MNICHFLTEPSTCTDPATLCAKKIIFNCLLPDRRVMNNTIICSLPDLIRYSFLQEFSKNIFFLICVLDVLVFLAASIGNTITLVALRRSQSIHPPSKALFCSLALSDLCVGLVVVPLHFGLMLANIVEVPSLYCALVSPTTVIAFVMASVSLMTTLTLKHHMSYQESMTFLSALTDSSYFKKTN